VGTNLSSSFLPVVEESKGNTAAKRSFATTIDLVNVVMSRFSG